MSVFLSHWVSGMVVVQGGTSKVKPIFEEIGQQLITLPQGGDDMLTVY